ncbi:MAG: aspartate-semialdehyde dehydrogenase [Erysipelotrichaceae bacterium]|nr:aspartate-semialdehyde dehydrogenase [Erysipelotrichaceae bacterium]
MRIGIIGASGAVGREMIQVLEEENIPVEEFRLFASERSLGKCLSFHGLEIPLQVVKEGCFDGLDVVLGACSAFLSKQYAKDIVNAGAVFIDNSSAFRLDKDVPLIVPEINGEDAKGHHGIISNPNCSTIITCMAVNAIKKLSPITGMIVSTYQAVSGAGAKGIDELKEEISALEKGEAIQPDVFPYQIAYNCIPAIGNEECEGYTSEEMKMENEGRKILHLPELNVSCTCVRVPVMRSHSISVSFATQDPLTLEEIREAILREPHVQLLDDYEAKVYPMPLTSSNQNDVLIGRLRYDRVLPNGIALFCCGDQIRKGAALNAVQIIKCL